MPHVSSQVANLVQFGPVIEIMLAPAGAAVLAFQREQAAVPAPVKLMAMVDTGAAATVVKQGIADQLHLNPVGLTYISTPSEAQIACPQYAMQIVFPSAVALEGVFVEAPLQNQPIQVLIGRDVLAHGAFVYLGHLNMFTLSF